MQARPPHMLQTLNKLTPNKVRFRWTEVENNCSNKLRILWPAILYLLILNCMTRNILLARPDFNKKIKIHTNTSDLQLEAVINQEGKQTTFHSIKVTTPQNIYSNRKVTS